MIPDKLDVFFAVYERELARAVAKYPTEYGYAPEQAKTVAVKMRKALIERTYNHGGYGFSWTCKALGIKHTRKAIEAYLTTP